MTQLHRRRSYGLLLLLVISSCTSFKLTSDKMHEYYQKRGYSFGIMIPKDAGSCGWVLSVSKDISYDPINMKDEKFFPFSLKKQPLFFKFLPLKMNNRCKDHLPIKLTEVLTPPRSQNQ